MGQSKSKRTQEIANLQENLKKSEYLNTLPMRSLKALAGMFLFLPLCFIGFCVQCFRKNEWPWELK